MIKLERKPLTREQLLERGKCCKCGCLNCPYGFNKKKKEEKKDELCDSSET